MMRRWALSVCAVVAVVAASSSAVQASPRPGALPGGDPVVGQLFGVAVVSADDVWAVGSREVGHGFDNDTLVQHWDGRSWAVVPSPSPRNAFQSVLRGVDAVSANDVWAVGEFRTDFEQPYHTLVEHWDGTSWRRVASPNPSVHQNGSSLTAVSASPGSIWAVGYYDPPGSVGRFGLVVRWINGHWSIVDSPNRDGDHRELMGVSATNATNGWAVGALIPDHSLRYRGLAEHWNGHSWNQVAIERPGSHQSNLRSVTVVAPGNAWAVGSFGDMGSRPLVEHFYAGHWHQVHPPGLGGTGTLESVSGSGPNNVWTIGYVGGATLLVHWNGSHWSRFRGPASENSTLRGVTADHPNATWAVGFQYRRHQEVPFSERWNGHVWTR